MLTLFLDLASHQGCLALVEDGRVAASVPVDHRISDRELMPLFEQCLKDAESSEPSSSPPRLRLDRIACVTGPGGFTSLRVAAAFANAMAYAADVPVAGIHLSDVYAARMAGSIFWLHSTKKQELFVRGFGKMAAKFSETTLCLLDEFVSSTPVPSSSGGGEFLWMGELLPAHEEAMAKKGGKKVELKPLEEVLPALLATLDYRKETLKPWYGRSW